MILVDSSVWVDHLRTSNEQLALLLERRRILVHPFVIGELALGTFRQRAEVLEDLQGLPPARLTWDDEVLRFINGHELFGIGIGYVDAHLLASTRLTLGASLWTRDRRLRRAAERLGIASTLD